MDSQLQHSARELHHCASELHHAECEPYQSASELQRVHWQVHVMQVDPAEWRLEVERVAPRLKITVASNARDWRSHLDDAHKHSAELSSLWPQAQTALSAVQTEVGCMHAITLLVRP